MARSAPTLRLATISHVSPCHRDRVPPRLLDSSSTRLPVNREAVEGGGHAARHHPMPTGVGVEPATCLGAHTRVSRRPCLPGPEVLGIAMSRHGSSGVRPQHASARRPAIALRRAHLPPWPRARCIYPTWHLPHLAVGVAVHWLLATAARDSSRWASEL